MSHGTKSPTDSAGLQSGPVKPARPNEAHWVRVGTLVHLEQVKVQVVKGADRPVAVFAHEGKVYAVDNRCPHLGFPLNKGTVHDGILTCHWHQARFDLCSGCTFDLWADDVPRFETKTQDGEVFVQSLPVHNPDRYPRQLLKGLNQNLGLLQAKGVVGMLWDGVPSLDVVKAILGFGLQRQNAPTGLTELAIAGRIAGYLTRETLYFTVLRGAQQVAGASANSYRRLREPLGGEAYDFQTLRHWFLQWIELRDQDAAERVLLTAIQKGATREQLMELLIEADSQRIYCAQGHPTDVVNKSFELLEQIGWGYAAQTLPLALGNMASGRGAEEDARWRQPIDLIALIRGAEGRLEDALKAGQGKAWKPAASFSAVLLGEDPAAIVEGLLSALAAGAPAEELSKRVAYAAAMRLAQFSNGNEVSDWFNPQHTFTYANAVDQLVRKSGARKPGVVRAVFHAAMSVYMDRFLNIPSAKLPDETAGWADALPGDGPGLCKQLLAELDGRAQAQSVTRIVWRYLELGLPLSDLIDTLALATIREDLDFHTLQVLEAGVCQARQWGKGVEARHIYVGVARSLSAFCPTPRARLKTARTALKLHNGESMHEEG